jgi:hypothetical protein
MRSSLNMRRNLIPIAAAVFAATTAFAQRFDPHDLSGKWNRIENLQVGSRWSEAPGRADLLRPERGT